MLPEELARHLLSFEIPQAAQDRYEALSIKANRGTATPDELSALDEFIELVDLLAIIRAKAEASLQPQHPAA
jgi:hypothetical protein